MTLRPPSPVEGDRTGYYSEARAWAAETLVAVGRSRATAWRLAALAIFVALLNGGALLALSPIRRSVPYLVTLRDQGGETQRAQPLQAGRIESDPTFTQAMLARYVTAREEFKASRLVHDFRVVELLSDPATRATYGATLQRTSGMSPVVLYLPSAILSVDIVSISLLDSGHALARFSTFRTDLSGAQPQPQQATIAFAYVHGPMRQVDRFENPLGFVVTAYAKSPA